MKNIFSNSPFTLLESFGTFQKISTFCILKYFLSHICMLNINSNSVGTNIHAGTATRDLGAKTLLKRSLIPKSNAVLSIAL